MKTILTLTSTAIGLALAPAVSAALIISQYVETNSGTVPKGIELWNSGAVPIDFSVTNLDIQQGTNGGALASQFTLATGSLAPGAVMVVGTSDIGTYLDTTFGAGVVAYHVEPFTFNGDDALQILLGGVPQDTFGTPGNDPGAAWTGGGVATQNSNLELKAGITGGDVDGFLDPSERFTTNNVTPASAGGLAGFGVAPVPEPSTGLLIGLSSAMLMRRRRQRR